MLDTDNRDDAIYFARLSEQGERYEDMIKYMKIVSKVSMEPPPRTTSANKSSIITPNS